jgi:hypothetical protein
MRISVSLHEEAVRLEPDSNHREDHQRWWKLHR